MKLVDVYPRSALNTPAAPAFVRVEIDSEGPKGVEVRAELLDRGIRVATGRVRAHLSSGTNTVEVPVEVPTGDARGYQVRVVVGCSDVDGVEPGPGTQVRATGGPTQATDLEGHSALLAASHWRSVPRYGFLSEFNHDSSRPIPHDAVRELAKFHVTIVQFYDWMYRHYQFLPPKEADGSWPAEFVDAMGRVVSPAVVAERVRQCAEYGMAPIAYGAVYGPEPEFILNKPEWLLYDSAGAPLHLIELFYITDLRPGGWREHILNEFERTVSEVGFEGIHMDQYGFPKLAYDAGGSLVDPSREFPGLIDEAAERVKAVNPTAGVIFNAVNDWPIDEVAESDQEAVYIEVWSPHDTYRDLSDLVRRARDLSGKQTILSAYLLPFHEEGPGAEWALRYITAVIAAAGGHHLVLGEGSAVLREPYYPDHGHLSSQGVRITRRYYDHSAAFTHYLHALDLRPVARNFTTGINTAFRLDGAAVSATPRAGSVWLNVTQRPGQFVLNLVNLTNVTDDRWNVKQPEAQPLRELKLICEPFLRVSRVTWASPDVSESAATPIAREITFGEGPGGSVEIELPELVLWATIVVEHA